MPSIVGFTTMSKQVPPEAVMVFLNTFFGQLDELCDRCGVTKIETAGDCYIVAGGIARSGGNRNPDQTETVTEEGQEGFTSILESHDPADSATRVMEFAKAMMACSKTVLTPHNNEPVVIRIGLHTGNCVSGLIGTKLPKFAIL
ncbi:guanylate cyclase [Haematococcus lacustris]